MRNITLTIRRLRDNFDVHTIPLDFLSKIWSKNWADIELKDERALESCPRIEDPL